MMDLSYLYGNNEQRLKTASVCKLQRTLPGSISLPDGQHEIGKIPAGASINGFYSYAQGFPDDITVNIGTTDNPIQFADGVTLVDGVPLRGGLSLYFETGATLVAEILTGNTGDDGTMSFEIDYTETETKVGAYTA